MKNRGYFLVALLIIITLIFPTACSGPSVNSGGNISAETPLITPQNVSQVNWNITGSSTEKTVGKPGGTVEKGGASISVPADALARESTVSITEFTQQPPPYVPKKSTSLPAAVSISKVYDLGPAGIQFAKPVQVTLAYDKSLLRSGVDKSKIALAYFNGENWIIVKSLVDTEKGTVSVATKGFPGEIITILVVGGLMVSAVAAGSYKAYQYFSGDPISNQKAHTYITPDNSTVADYTQRAGARASQNGKPVWVPLEDPAHVGQINPDFVTYAKTAYKDEVHDNRIGFDGSGSKSGVSYPSYSTDKNFQMPEEFFKGGQSGDCTAVATAYTSMLRRLGVEAYAVDGYKSNTGQGASRHTWVEFTVDGETYYYDNDEGIKPLKEVESNLNRPVDVNGEGYMWNEDGQKIYQKDWWESIKDESATGIREDFRLTPVFNTKGSLTIDQHLIKYASPIEVIKGAFSAQSTLSEFDSPGILGGAAQHYTNGNFMLSGSYDPATGLFQGTYAYGHHQENTQWKGEQAIPEAVKLLSKTVIMQ